MVFCSFHVRSVFANVQYQFIGNTGTENPSTANPNPRSCLDQGFRILSASPVGNFVCDRERMKIQ